MRVRSQKPALSTIMQMGGMYRRRASGITSRYALDEPEDGECGKSEGSEWDLHCWVNEVLSVAKIGCLSSPLELAW